MSKLPKHRSDHQKFERPTIDLTREENCLLQGELATICKIALAEKGPSTQFSNSENRAQDAGLLENLARFFNNYFNPATPVLASHIATVASAADAIDTLLFDICEQGDGFLIAVGSGLRNLACSSVQLVEVDMFEFFDTPAINLVSRLAAAMDEAPCQIRALVLTNPHKTLGKCYPQDVLEECLKFCQQRDIQFISDEEYALTAFSCAEISAPIPFISVLSLDTRALKCDRSRVHTIWSISKDFGATGFTLGCIVAQNNAELITRLATSPNSQRSSSSAKFTTTLLSSPTFPFLIALNSARLAEAYISITRFFTERSIRYIPVSAGLNIFAKLAPRAKTWDNEDEMVEKLRDAGVLVSAGRQYNGRPKGKGWARLSFSVEPRQLEEALRRIDVALGTSMQSTI